MQVATFAAPGSSTALPSGLPTQTPAGFISFCSRFPDQCATAANPTDIIETTPDIWQILARINAETNSAIEPEDDEDHYGKAEYWTIPTDGLGDCEDYVLAKRRALIAAGLPADALRVALVKLRNGELHAVLTVSTDQGDYVLDSLQVAILPWTKTGYTWLERQSAGNPWVWVALNNL